MERNCNSKSRSLDAVKVKMEFAATLKMLIVVFAQLSNHCICTDCIG